MFAEGLTSFSYLNWCADRVPKDKMPTDKLTTDKMPNGQKA